MTTALGASAAACSHHSTPGASSGLGTNAAASPAPTTTTAPVPGTTSVRPPAPKASSSTSAPPTTVAAVTLAVPPPVTPLVSPRLAGEGTWVPAGDRLAGGYAIYTTTLRPAAGAPPSGVAWIDSKATQVSLYAGTGQPYGVWPQQSDVAIAEQPLLVAAFNSGFKIYNYDTGWYDQGRSAMALQAGAASLVIYRNGTATVADWGRDAALNPQVVAVRQNLSLLVDHGVAAPAAQLPAQWGAVLGGGSYTWRSAVGVTAAGDLVYAAGPELTPALLAGLMVAAGAARAMELDINPQWVSFASFTHAGGIGGSPIAGTNLLPGMYYVPDHYLRPFTRDFFAVFAR